MMNIIVGKEFDNCVSCGKTVSYWDNGYPTFDGITAYPTELFNVFEVEGIPDGDITEYCYTVTDGFTSFEPPEPPEPQPEEQKYTLNEATALITSEVSK